MKNMDYEKKYNEALNWMRELYPGLHGATKEDAEHYFPELKESEDERIRKGIIDVIQRAGFISSEYKYEAIAWLEKQKEIQFDIPGLYYYDGKKIYYCDSPATEENLEKQDVDFSTNNISKNDARKRRQIIALLSASKEKCMVSFVKDIDECIAYLIEKQKEQKPVEPSDDELRRHQDELYDFKVFATKQAKEHHISFVHDFEWNNFCAELLSYFAEQKPAEDWREKRKKECPFRIADGCKQYGGVISECTGACSWVVDYPKLKEIQDKRERKSAMWRGDDGMKPAKWSKEDEKMLLSIINDFRIGAVSTIGQEQWLNLIPERFNLQPSLEHLQKEKVYDIMAKLTNLSYSNLIPFNSEEYKKINEITSDVFDLLKYPIEKKQEQKPEAKLTGWVARDKEDDSDSGLGLVLFKGKPRRACNCWIGAAVKQPLTWEMFPDLKWEDEPMEVEITITKK